MDMNEIEVTRLKDQIADLKAELVELSGRVSEGVEDVRLAARPAMGVIRDNPGTISSVAVAAGLIGVALGYVLGSSASGSRWHL